MTVALVIALAGQLGMGSSGGVAGPTGVGASRPSSQLRGFDIPRLSWPPARKIEGSGSSGLLAGLKVTASRHNTRPLRPVCTIRLVPADPEIDPAIGIEPMRDVDSAMIVRSRCAE